MKSIFLAGHTGMVGKAFLRYFEKQNIANVLCPTRRELDLLRQDEVEQYIARNDIDEIILCAGKVGGILANQSQPAAFIYENILIMANIIQAAHHNDIQKLLLFGSSCIYPKFASQPINENSLLTGQLEQTNAPYAIAKIAGLQMCKSYHDQYGRDYRAVMPTNLYGPSDNFHIADSHVLPALIHKIHYAKTQGKDKVYLWGTGTPKREFLFIDDCIDACIEVLKLPENAYWNLSSGEAHINIGSGKEIEIKFLAKLVKEVINYNGTIIFDENYPDGTPRKLLDSSKILSTGWRPRTSLKDGIQIVFNDYLQRRRAT